MTRGPNNDGGPCDQHSTAVPAIQAVAPTPSPQPTRIPGTSIRTLAAIDDVTAQRFYALYVETFGELAIRAVNRHLLRREEFMAVMVDARIDKIVIEDDATTSSSRCAR